MPSPEWNRRWVDEMELQKGEKYKFYGEHWGDPDPTNVFPSRIRRAVPRSLLLQMARVPLIVRFFEALPTRNKGHRPLAQVVTRYIQPYVNSDTVVLEIGAGGGRWTAYMLDAKEIIHVELNVEFFDYLRERFPEHVHKFRFYQTRDYEMDGIADNSVDFVFSFGTFVHIEPEGIQQYLTHIARVLKPGQHAVIQYANKNTERGQERTGFSQMTPDRMESFVTETPGLSRVEHVTDLLPHSSVILLRKG